MTRTVRDHGMFREGDLVLVAVSGGPDSVSLLYALASLRRLLGIRLEVFTFDHRLREGSAEDAAYVRRIAGRIGLPFHLRQATEGPRRGESVEAWATAARGRAAEEVRRSIGASVLAEGHTLDDRAETVLLNLIRGGGLEAVAGIWPGDRRAGSTVVQPLIDVEREQVEAFCRALGLRPRRDPTNLDPRHLRNAIRLRVLPAIERATGREVRRAIARSAALLDADRLELHRQAARLRAAVVREEAGVLRFDAARLRALPPALASRVVRSALTRLSIDDGGGLTRDAVEAVLDLARGRPGRRRDLPAGSTAAREGGYVLVSRASPESRV